MNKIHIKARFKDEDVSSYLVRSLFFDFRSKGSIDIKDGKVDIKLACGDVPMEIIDTITYFCIIDEFHMSESEDEPAESKDDKTTAEDTKDSSESKVKTKTQVSDDIQIGSEKIAPEGDVSIRTEFKKIVPVESLVEPELNSVEIPKVDIKQSKKTNITMDANHGIDDICIPELDEFAKKASNYKDFVSLVAEWINFGSRNNLFVDIAVAATQVEKISWNELSKKVFVTQTDKMQMGRNASHLFKKYSLSMLSFLKVLVKYDKNFSSIKEDVSGNEISESEGQNLQDVVLKDKSVNNNVSSGESMVKMHCMPRIQSFESALESIDKTQPIEERVKKILTFMADGKKIENEIFIMVNTAITLKKIELSVVFAKSGLNAKEYGSSWMMVSKFINDYVQQYVSGTTVKATVFIEELQRVLLTEEELENL